jgi:hypothetical protein
MMIASYRLVVIAAPLFAEVTRRSGGGTPRRPAPQEKVAGAWPAASSVRVADADLSVRLATGEMPLPYRIQAGVSSARAPSRPLSGLSRPSILS